MLLNLDIKNAALIEHIMLEFDRGLTVLTGETGAGKSVIIDSVNMILGARSSKNIVRYGEKKAVVQALFDGMSTGELLEESGIPAEDDTVIINRELSSDGKSICRINGVMTVLNIVREIGQNLITIHGQQDSQALLNPARHIDFLDAYAKNEAIFSDYQKLYLKKKEIETLLSSLEMDEAEKLRRIDLLKYQVQEIEAAQIKPGEKADLQKERILIQNGEKISSALNETYEYLYQAEQAAYDRLSLAVSALSNIADTDARIEEQYQKLSDIQYAVDDISHEIHDIASGIDYDEESLNEVESRLDLITRLEKKYGTNEEAILAYFEKASQELLEITEADTRKEQLTLELNEVLSELTKAADQLTVSRQKAGERLAKEIEKELQDLDMPHAQLIVSVLPIGNFVKNGADKIEFLISPNRGEPPKPLDKIASGGELSRVMLAIKTILADTDQVETLIFDEIDTGVSGSAAQKIAQKLSHLAQKKQIICVSHQPQLAAAADNHFKIKKIETDNRTITTVEVLNDELRIHEIARIIDGDRITETSIEHAKQMMDSYKKDRDCDE